MARVVVVNIDDTEIGDWIAPGRDRIHAAVTEFYEVTMQVGRAIVELTPKVVELAERTALAIATPKEALVWRDPAGVVHGSYNSEARDQALAQCRADLAALATAMAEIMGPASVRLAELTETVVAEMASLNETLAPWQPGPHETAEQLTAAMSAVHPAWPPR